MPYLCGKRETESLIGDRTILGSSTVPHQLHDDPSPISCDATSRPELYLNESGPNPKLFPTDIVKLPVHSCFNIADLSYPLPISSGPEPLLYVTILVKDREIKALVDCGATRTFIGPTCLKLAKELNCTIGDIAGSVQLANGKLLTVATEVTLPIQLQGRTKSLRTRVIDSL